MSETKTPTGMWDPRPCRHCDLPEERHDYGKEDWEWSLRPRCRRQGLLSFLRKRRYSPVAESKD